MGIRVFDDNQKTTLPVHVIGAGLAGSEAAWQLAESGVPVVLHEMRPVRATEAHQTDSCAELVCSNSFRSDDHAYNAVGLLHDEMRRCGSLIMRAADANQVPAGGALAVDRHGFADAVTKALNQHPLITLTREELTALPEPVEGWQNVIIATGPLTSTPLAESIRDLTGQDSLAFFDAIAPIVHRDSIDMSKAWMQSRYDKVGPGGTGSDYINCAMDRAQYEHFIRELIAAPKTDFKEWEKPQSRLRPPSAERVSGAQSSRGEEESTPYFEGCLPIEVMAERGVETLRYGPMKPVGLTNPHSSARPYAVVQLRQDNALGTLYNLVGFQTKMKYAEQTRVFRLIPGLENAEFARLGGLHRNTFINSPVLLDRSLRLKARPSLRFAGQMTGVEGYIESAAIGLLAGRFAGADHRRQGAPPPPRTTALGALLAHITGDAEAETFQPMNVNFGLFPPITTGPSGRERKKSYTDRAKRDLQGWLAADHRS